MQAKGYHVNRLVPEVEQTIQNILNEGSNKIVEILHEHFKGFVLEYSEKIFEEILIEIATTVSKVASLPDLYFESSGKKRIAFLPGYTTKEKKRVMRQVKVEKKYMPSDIAFNIISKGKVEQVKETYSNQSLLFYYLLDHHGDDLEFLNGGTHQFLIANAHRLRTKANYQIDLLQVFTGDKMSEEKDEITFLSIEVDFKEMNSVDKLYNHFDKMLNKDDTELRWPLSIQDIKNDYSQKRATYQMRGYLVSLWYKLLHDTNKINIDDWFDECINFAKTHRFKKLVERLSKLKNIFKRDDGEFYNFWYSLTFDPLPDFTVINKTVIETLGSAMFMTNYELRPQFFFWVQPWINTIYRNIRDFENLERHDSIIVEDITKSINQENKYYPLKVIGNRWLRSDTSQKHMLPLFYYFRDFFSEENQIQHAKPYTEAKELLDVLSLIKWIDEINTLPKSENINSLRIQLMQAFGNFNKSKKYGILLDNLEGNQKHRTRILFSHRLSGRVVTLACYLYLGYSMNLIHSILVNNILEEKEIYPNNHTPSRTLKKMFFIHGFDSNDSTDGRLMNFTKICLGLSMHEKTVLNDWWNSNNEFLKMKLINTPELLEAILEKKKSLHLPIF